MLKIRLQRVGRKHEPVFRLVLTDSKNSTKSGKFIENLGNYDSRQGDKSNFKTDRVSHWMSMGAQVSGTVHNILVSNKVITGKKVNVLPLKKPIVPEEVTKAEVEVKPKVLAEEKVVEVSEVEVTPDVAEEVVVETPTTPVA